MNLVLQTWEDKVNFSIKMLMVKYAYTHEYIHPITTSLGLQWKVLTTNIIWKQAYSTLMLTGECLEVSLQKNLNCLQLASVSLLRPLHSLPLGSGLSAFIRRSNNHLHHLDSDLTSLCSGFSLSVCPSPSLTLFSEASASWLHSKYCFDQQQGNPFIAKWNPNMESAGNYFLNIYIYVYLYI